MNVLLLLIVFFPITGMIGHELLQLFGISNSLKPYYRLILFVAIGIEVALICGAAYMCSQSEGCGSTLSLIVLGLLALASLKSVFY